MGITYESTSRTIDVDGRSMHYHEAGSGPTLVFLHEGLGSIGQWKDFPEAVARATGLPALIYDRWGFGGSEPVSLPRPDDYLWQEAREALPDLLRACGVAKPVLIGHSDGGTIALLYALSYPRDHLVAYSLKDRRPRDLARHSAHQCRQRPARRGRRIPA